MFSVQTFSGCLSRIDENMMRLSEENHSTVVEGVRDMSDACFLEMTREDWNGHRGEIEDVLSRKSVYSKMLVYDWYASVIEDESYIDRMLELIRKEGLTYAERRYVTEQLRGRMFSGSVTETEERRRITENIFREVLEAYENQLSPRLVPNLEERNRDLVIVMTGQLLLPQHAPTKSALNQCHVLIERMKKQVILVNVADVESKVGEIPLAQYAVGNYIDAYSRCNFIPYKNIKIPLIQMDRGMPSVDGIQGLIDMLCELKPYYMVMVGSGSVVMDICAGYVPTLLVPLTAEVAYTRAECQLQYVKESPETASLGDEVLERLTELGKTSDHIIFKQTGAIIDEQKETGTREYFGIPEGRFIGVVVGNRLETEVKDDFVHRLNASVQAGLFIVFVGAMKDRYQEICRRYVVIADNSLQFDFVEDIMALYDCCDLYINPERRGGGISAVDALYKGVPVVTLKDGDVYYNAGDAFAVDDYEEMEKEILRHLEDYAYHAEKATLAKKIGHEMVEANDDYFVVSLQEFVSRI